MIQGLSLDLRAFGSPGLGPGVGPGRRGLTRGPEANYGLAHFTQEPYKWARTTEKEVPTWRSRVLTSGFSPYYLSANYGLAHFTQGPYKWVIIFCYRLQIWSQ